MASKKIFLIDAMGFVFRAFYAPMPMRMASGVPTKVPYLFALMLRRMLNDHQPDYLAVVFDPPGPTFRDELFKEYKAQRPPMPEDLRVQLPYVRKLCDAMRLPRIEFPGYEADDAIGALAQQAAKKKLEVFIVTSDKDMLQLIGKGIKVVRPSSRGGGEERIVDEKGVVEILGVPPEKVVDLMALMGDSVDNIPGAKGIGEKGAVELIQRFGTVEKALDNAEKVANKRYREALQNQREQVMLSKKLARISADAPVSLDLQGLERREPDVESLRAFYSELNFSSLLKELPAQAAPTPSGTTDYTQFESPEVLAKYLFSLPPGRPVAVWIETAPGSETEEEPGFGSRVVAIEVSPKAGVARWIEFGGREEFQLSAEKGQKQSRQDGSTALPSASLGTGTTGAGATQALRAWLGDEKRQKIVHDPKLVDLLLGETRGVTDAVELYSYLLRPITSKHSLADVALRHLNTQPSSAHGEGAEFVGRLAPMLRDEVKKAGLLRLYEKIDLPLAGVLARMERHGVQVDTKALAGLSSAAEREIRSLESQIWKLAGTEFNVNSPAQLAEILFDKLGLEPPARRGRTKGRSTAADVLEELAATHEIPRLVLEFRELSKLKSTYADALPKLIHPETGRIHTRLSQTGTATGRLSSSNPNLQNIPVRTELGKQIRAAFTAPKGCVLLSADYSQIELRLLAHFSQDAVLLDAFRRGEDIHARTAQEVFGVGPLAQTQEHRRIAKVINFGIIYGLSAFGLAQQLGIEQKEASEFIKAYFARYPRVKEYLERSVAEARKTGYSANLFGRKREIPEINSSQMGMRSFAERTALNTPLQGTAADLIKVAMIEIDKRFQADAKLGETAKMILQVHDELLFEVREDALEKLGKIVKPAMESVGTFDGPLSVPLVVEMKSGKTWAELK
jgi:DNA polymerase-1